MKNTLFFLACSALLLCQCRSLHPSDFRSTPALPERLPPLRLLMHQASFAQAFNSALANQAIAPAEPWTDYSLTQGAFLHASRLLQNELADNVMQSVGKQVGQARFKLLFYERHNSGWGYTIPSVLSMMTANVIGLPFGTVCTELELQLEIADAEGKSIVIYSAPGVGKAKVACYYGYLLGDAIRKANLDAMKSAVKAMETRLQQDVPMLTARMTTAGD